MDYGLIGEKLGHSFSKEIHTAFGKYEYELLEIKPENLQAFLTEKKFKGINVTIPYKEKVIPYLDEISVQAEKIGAVNTIVNKDGRLYGYNTDYYGFIYMLSLANINVKGKVVAVLGTGGAGKTANVALGDLGAKEVISVSRSGAVNYSNVNERADIQVIVNASPVGMYPNNGECLIDIDNFTNLEGVVDIVYNPYVTELLSRAKKKGINCVNGLSMLVAQAKYACELFLGIRLDDGVIEKIINKVRFKTQNVTLIGMPGSGKTSIGKHIATSLDREFIDTDEEFFSKYNMTAKECIEAYGEKVFREMEAQVIFSTTIQSRKVIATGGGAILREDNQKNIASNSIVVWVKRDINELPMNDRPLSKDIGALKKLYAERMPIYSKLSDITVENCKSIEEASREILAQITEN